MLIAGKKEMKWARVLPFFLVLLVFSSPVLAHEGEKEQSVVTIGTLEQSLHSLTLNVIYAAIAVLAVISVFIIVYKKQFEKGKKLKVFLFSLIVITVASATIFTASATIYLNVVSYTKGPVHWHADFEVWNCGSEIELKDHSGLVNRIGSSTFHEHGDNRIHMEGVVTDLREASLHTFFHLTGSELSDGVLEYNTNEGLIVARDGDLCSGQPGKVQVFAYRILNPDDWKEWEYEQVKLENYEDYVLSPHSNVPPGDCIIVEFDAEKNATDKLCASYEVAMQKGELRGS